MTSSLTLPPLEFDLNKANFGIPAWRSRIEDNIDEYLEATGDIRATIAHRSAAVDALLIKLFEHYDLDAGVLALFAVGGYGRGEMLPFSDVDILLLSHAPLEAGEQAKLEQFVAKLWDTGLEPGLSVRTLDECFSAASDLSVATSLLENRLLAGKQSLATAPKKIMGEQWTDKSFFEGKMAEAKARYSEHNATEYNLEPNVKNAPGGLRDVHHIGWICKRYFRINKLSDLVHQSFMTDAEYRELEAAETFLLTVRHHLHRITGRGENRLLFDHQRKVAIRMGYTQDNVCQSHRNAEIEALMRVYYRKAMRISTLSEMLSAYYFETLIQPRLPEEQKPQTTVLDDDFEIIGYRISARHSKVFSKNPANILRLFVLMGEHGIKKIRAKTLRLVRTHSTLIDEDFRRDAHHRALFMSILNDPNYLFHRLRKMKRYGVLGRYLPAFEQVMGLMQYDLFHRYTVDAHTLLLFRILHRLGDKKYAKHFGMVHGIYQRLERKDIIHLATLFHDIAKGRGGDHSELGAHDAYVFCKNHGLCEADANLVSWLVNFHLLMSITAQKRDISDPDVVEMFAAKVGDMVHLNYLYVLTVADMNATNTELWNSWRASLMGQLYVSTRNVLKAGLGTAYGRDTMITQTKTQALTMLAGECATSDVKALWHDLNDDYFLRETPSDIAWHTRAIIKHANLTEPLILVREHRELMLDAVQVFIYTQDRPNLFATTINVFNRMNLDVQDARITTATRDFALDTYVLIDRRGTLLKDSERKAMLKDALAKAIAGVTDNHIPKISPKRLPRQLKHFDVPTKVTCRLHKASGFNELSIETLDQPGLLALIGCVFLQHDIEVHSARITTLGERAEDVFLITDRDDTPLSEDRITSLIDELTQTLEHNDSPNLVCL